MFFNRRLWPFTRGVRGRMALNVSVGVAAAATGIARLALLGWLLAMVYAGAGLAEIAWPAAAIAALMVLRGVLEHARAMLAHGTAACVQLEVRSALYDHLLALGPAYLTRERSGGVMLTMGEGVEQLETYFGQYLPQLAVATLTPLAVFAGVALVDLPVALVLLAFAIATLLAPTLFHSWDERNSQRRRHAYHDYGAEFMDAMQGLATLKAFGQSAARGRRLAERAREVTRSTMWVLATNLLTRGITDTGIAVGAAAALALGAYRVEAGQMSLAALLMILMMGIEVFRPQRDLRSLLHQGMVGRAAADGIFALLDAKPLVPEAASGARPPASLAPTLRFDGVHFAYPGTRSAAHEDLSFEVRAGERVGFVGQSGCGKSTVVRLLLRAFDPDRGAVEIGGRDLRTLEADTIYRQLAVVGQDAFLFHGTVAENLRVGRAGASSEDIERAARDANAHEFVRRLPQGYDTVIGERGIRLSGGQRQRLAIARALLSDAPILVLDEALSAVDAENEAVIASALDRLMEGRTTLIFAHRLSSVARADRLLVMDAGKVVESGSHADLMRSKGAYHRLMASQAEESRAAHDATPIGAGDESAEETGEWRHAPADDSDILRAEGIGWLAAARALLRHARPWTGKLTLTFALGIVRVASLIGVGVVSALAVAAVKTGDAYGHWLWTLAVLAPAAGVLHWLESWLAHDLAFEMLAEMRIKLYAKLEKLAPAFLVRRRSGDLVAMATHDVELVEYFYAHTVTPALVAVLVPGAVLVVLLDAAWPLAAALAPFLLAVGVSPFALRKRVDTLGSRDREALGELNAHIADTVQGLGEVLAFRDGARRKAGLVERARQHARLRLAFFRDLSTQQAFLEVATGLGGLAIVVTGAHLAAGGAVDSTYLPLLTLLGLSAFLPISEIAEVSRQLADTLGATRRLEAVWREGPVVTDGPGRDAAGSAHADAAALEFDAVTFAYPGFEARALDGVDLEVPAGATVALVGASGAGKTTIAHLALRFWDPVAGAVRMGGVDLHAHRLDDVRACVALVGQDTYLFNQSLRENVALAKPDASEPEIEAAVARASLAPFVESLPDGLDTIVGERGARLSGGQRQRVAIARAFLKDAPILILDEATSSLDALNEAAVRAALRELMHDRTTLVIAHRLSTVRDADRIYVLDRGRVVEHGAHGELLEAGGYYARLVDHQLSAAAAE